jgi:multidrug transporter EmrE-like cation transporter
MGRNFIGNDYRLTSATTLDEPPILDSRAAARRSFLLVFLCTLIGAVAQLLIKQGTAQLGAHVTLANVAQRPALFVDFCLGMLRNMRLFGGYCLYGVNTFLMALALKGRELSRLYPIIALTYVWVTILSLAVLANEHMNFFRGIGIAFIVVGVSVLGVKK